MSEGVTEGQPSNGRLVYFFTTYPVDTETFLQREQRLLRASGTFTIELWSLWRGEREWEGRNVQGVCGWSLLGLLWWLPWEIGRRPMVWCDILRELWKRPAPQGGEFIRETLWGLLCGGLLAHRFRRSKERIWLHAAWGGLPATCVLVIARLNDQPWSFEAHAYDIFQGGGDWLLPCKLRHARAMRTSTQSAAGALHAIGRRSLPLVVIRRGLDTFPEFMAKTKPHDPLRILGIGRLIPKKGWLAFLHTVAEIRRRGFAVEVRIVGGGPLEEALKLQILRLGLRETVRLEGALSFAETQERHRWADVLLFTGEVAADGDRDGLPNVIPEAMACGTPVVATRVGGVGEAVLDGTTGLLIDPGDTFSAASAVLSLRQESLREHLAHNARRWVEEAFDGRRNAIRLHKWFEELMELSPNHPKLQDQSPSTTLPRLKSG
jgi:colanic acid/amylovoran biosynthesis glycosyltransferase